MGRPLGAARIAAAALLALATGAACRRNAGGTGSTSSASPAAPPVNVPFRPANLPRIDAHAHLTPEALGRALDLMGSHGITQLIDLSGGSPMGMLQAHIAAANATGGRVAVFTTPSFREALKPGYGKRLADQLVIAKSLGAIGVKIPKALGLGWIGPDYRLLHVDDPELGPMWEKAGELDMPVAIHIGDPKAFWRPIDEKNERIDELGVHPGWGYYGGATEFGEPIPSWETLYAQFERLVAAHPKTTFIGVHFGNDPEDPAAVDAMLTKYPNFYIDTAARIPEIGRQDKAHDRDKMRAFFIKWQDRILFGTDTAVGVEADELMLGSSGKDPPGPADVERFFDATFRYFETGERGMRHPTPIQGRWLIDGVDLPREVLEKIYAKNAARLLHLTILPPAAAAPPAPSVPAK